MPILVEDSRIHLGALFALLSVLGAAVLLGRTLIGFEIRVLARRRGPACSPASRRPGPPDLPVSGALAGLAGICEVAGPVGHLQPCDLARLWLYRDHRRLPRPAQPARHLDRRPCPGPDLPRRRAGADRDEDPADVTKVFQGILLFFVLACDSLILYRIRLVRAEPKAGPMELLEAIILVGASPPRRRS